MPRAWSHILQSLFIAQLSVPQTYAVSSTDAVQPVGVTRLQPHVNDSQLPLIFLIKRGVLQLHQWDGHNWSWDRIGAPPGAELSTGVGAIAGSASFVFTVDMNGTLWETYKYAGKWTWQSEGSPCQSNDCKIAPLGVLNIDCLTPTFGATQPAPKAGARGLLPTFVSLSRPGAAYLIANNRVWLNTCAPKEKRRLWLDIGTPDSRSRLNPIRVIAVQNGPKEVGRPYIWVSTDDNHLWERHWEGLAWAEWIDLGPLPSKRHFFRIGVVDVQNNPDASQRFYIYLYSDDGHLWEKYWTGHSVDWVDLGIPPGGTITGAVGALTVQNNANASDRPYTYVTAKDGHVWLSYWTETQKRVWVDQGRPGKQFAIDSALGVITVMDTGTSPQRPYVFVTSGDHHIWCLWWTEDQRLLWADMGPVPD